MRIAFDTNVLVYAESRSSDPRKQRAIDVLDRIDREQRVLPAQVITELFYVLTRKSGLSKALASAVVLSWIEGSSIAPTDTDVVLLALELASFHTFSIWDAIVVASAASAGCELLLSEDMNHGFSWSGVTIVNPFLDEPHVLLERALAP